MNTLELSWYFLQIQKDGNIPQTRHWKIFLIFRSVHMRYYLHNRRTLSNGSEERLTN